jgi:hypothetical protein
MNSLSHNKLVCFVALAATIIFSLGTCSGYLFAADVTEVVEEEVVVEEAPVEVGAEESTTTETSSADEPTGEGETPAGEEDGFWDGPWPWILGGAVVVGGGIGIAAAASGGGGGGGDDYNVVGTWGVTFDWKCDGSYIGHTTWYIRDGGTFTGSGGSSGTWTLSGNSIRLNYSNVYDTVYSGTVSSNTNMEGRMSNNIGDSGCWSANKSASAMQSISSGESDSCDLHRSR